MEYYLDTKRNKFESVLVMWMNLEPVIQSDVSQRKINMYQHIYIESRKIVLMNLFAGMQWGRKCREWTCGHSEGGREWDD